MRGADFMHILNSFYPSTSTLKAYRLYYRSSSQTHTYILCVHACINYLIQFTVLKATLIIFIIMLHICSKIINTMND